MTFGWRTNDADNSLGGGTIGNSTIYEGTPWIGVIRASDMKLVYDEADDEYLDVAAIATELSTP